LTVGHVYNAANPSVKVGRKKYTGEEDEDEDDMEKITWQAGEKFSSLTVWEHHTLPDEKHDHWIRGVQEWISVAETVNHWIFETHIDEFCGI
jgi:hypothetical protein